MGALSYAACLDLGYPQRSYLSVLAPAVYDSPKAVDPGWWDVRKGPSKTHPQGRALIAPSSLVALNSCQQPLHALKSPWF